MSEGRGLFLRKIDIPLVVVVTAATAVVAAVLITGYHGANSAPQQKTDYWEWITSAAFWTALFTGVLTWSTIQLWSETDRLAQGAERSSERQLRAYVGVDTGVVFLDVPDQGSIEAVTLVKNYGATPAANLRAWQSMTVRPVGFPPYSERGEPEGKTMLFPGASVYYQCSVSISPPVLAGIVAGTLKIYVWGRIDYTDAFNEPRHMTFRKVLGGKPGGVRIATSPERLGWVQVPDPEFGDEAN